MDSANNLKLTLKRLRRLLEHPRKHYWRTLDRKGTATKKYEKLTRKADELSKRIYDLTGEEL